MKFKLTFLLCLTLLVSVLSCRKIYLEEPVLNVEDPFLKEAKNFFYNKVNGSESKYTTAKIQINSSLVKITPLWVRSYTSKTSINTFIEVPIIASKKEITLYNFTKELSDQKTDMERLSRSFQRLLIYKNSSSSGFNQVIITYIPDIKHIKEAKTDIAEIKINSLQKFSGYIEYKSVNGNKMFTIRFENGKAVTKYFFINKPTKNSLLNTLSGGGSNPVIAGCYQECSPVYSQICSELGDPPVEYCGGWVYEGENCVTVCDPNVPDDPNTCLDPNNFYLCNPDSGSNPQDGISANLKKLMGPGSHNLSVQQLSKLSALIEVYLTNCNNKFIFDEIHNSIPALNFRVLEPNNQPFVASYNPFDKTITFVGDAGLSYDNLLEEMFHTFQDNVAHYPLGIAPYTNAGRANLEFEAELYLDIFRMGFGIGFGTALAIEDNSDYRDFVLDFDIGSTLNSSDFLYWLNIWYNQKGHLYPNATINNLEPLAINVALNNVLNNPCSP